MIGLRTLILLIYELIQFRIWLWLILTTIFRHLLWLIIQQFIMILSWFLNCIYFPISIKILNHLLLERCSNVIMIHLFILIFHHLHMMFLFNLVMIVLPCIFIPFYITFSHHLISVFLIQISPIIPFIIRWIRHFQFKYSFEYHISTLIHVFIFKVYSYILFQTVFSKSIRIIVSQLRLWIVLFTQIL